MGKSKQIACNNQELNLGKDDREMHTSQLVRSNASVHKILFFRIQIFIKLCKENGVPNLE